MGETLGAAEQVVMMGTLSYWIWGLTAARGKVIAAEQVAVGDDSRRRFLGTNCVREGHLQIQLNKLLFVGDDSCIGVWGLCVRGKPVAAEKL